MQTKFIKNIPNKIKFKNKYRIPSARLPNYDYSQNGSYFITICTKNRESFFGEIKNGKMQLSEIGKIVAIEWIKTEQIRSHIILGQWMIMPNHFHGILIVNNDGLQKRSNKYYGSNPQMSQISPTKNSISTAIRFFKRQTTIESRKINPNFAWQSRFHDHIIRNENEFNRISQYIMFNPRNWKNDKFAL